MNQREKIIAHLTESKGWTTIFYITETQARAKAFMRLEKEGVLVRDRVKEGNYPNLFFNVHHADPS